jgi:hypothetical protein
MRVPALLAVVIGASCRATPSPERITLERTGCFGVCPAYRVSIDSRGLARYDGPGFVEVWRGTRLHPQLSELDSVRLSPNATAAIFASFAHGWSRWRPNRFTVGRVACPRPSTDNPSVTMVREWSHRRDTIELYYGCSWAPPELARSAQQIDSLVQVERWLGAFPHP